MASVGDNVDVFSYETVVGSGRWSGIRTGAEWAIRRKYLFNIFISSDPSRNANMIRFNDMIFGT
jgi:hypothetical protein